MSLIEVSLIEVSLVEVSSLDELTEVYGDAALCGAPGLVIYPPDVNDIYQRDRLTAAVGQLSPAEFEVARLVNAGHTLHEAAADLNISYKAAQRRWHRARRRLANLLADFAPLRMVLIVLTFLTFCIGTDPQTSNQLPPFPSPSALPADERTATPTSSGQRTGTCSREGAVTNPDSVRALMQPSSGSLTHPALVFDAVNALLSIEGSSAFRYDPAVKTLAVQIRLLVPREASSPRLLQYDHVVIRARTDVEVVKLAGGRNVLRLELSLKRCLGWGPGDVNGLLTASSYRHVTIHDGSSAIP